MTAKFNETIVHQKTKLCDCEYTLSGVDPGFSKGGAKYLIFFKLSGAERGKKILDLFLVKKHRMSVNDALFFIYS